MVGVSRTYSFELTMPGGATIPAAAVSWVSVLPTHRRRGVLTQMMAAMHDDARERDEPAAILTASESSIYGRFGYGVAAWRLGLTAERARIAFAACTTTTPAACASSRETKPRGCCRRSTNGPGRTRAGMVSRPDFWWDQVFWDFMLGRAKANFIAIHSDADGHDDGYVVYEIIGDGSGGLTDRPQALDHRHAGRLVPASWIALWRYVFGVDLIGTVAAFNLPIDDPLRHVVVDGRWVRVDFVNDHLWLAPLDPLAVLGARTYTVPGRVVIEVHAPDGTCSTVAVESIRERNEQRGDRRGTRPRLRVRGARDVRARRQPLE